MGWMTVLGLAAASLLALAIAAIAMVQGMFFNVGDPGTVNFWFLLAVVLALVARMVAQRRRGKPGWSRM